MKRNKGIITIEFTGCSVTIFKDKVTMKNTANTTSIELKGNMATLISTLFKEDEIKMIEVTVKGMLMHIDLIQTPRYLVAWDNMIGEFFSVNHDLQEVDEEEDAKIIAEEKHISELLLKKPSKK